MYFNIKTIHGVVPSHAWPTCRCQVLGKDMEQRGHAYGAGDIKLMQ